MIRTSNYLIVDSTIVPLGTGFLLIDVVDPELGSDSLWGIPRLRCSPKLWLPGVCWMSETIFETKTIAPAPQIRFRSPDFHIAPSHSHHALQP
jgi:hypothetical protein